MNVNYKKQFTSKLQKFKLLERKNSFDQDISKSSAFNFPKIENIYHPTNYPHYSPKTTRLKRNCSVQNNTRPVVIDRKPLLARAKSFSADNRNLEYIDFEASWKTYQSKKLEKQPPEKENNPMKNLFKASWVEMHKGNTKISMLKILRIVTLWNKTKDKLWPMSADRDFDE